MANDMCTRRLTRELQSIQRSPLTNPAVQTTPLESNILEWHYVMEGSKDTPYEGGHYWGKLIFPKEYPLKPPSVMMLTPNGRFKTGRRLCLSMSDFHPESWNPMWSVSTIITGLISFMVESAPTLGSIETSTSKKKLFASTSLEFNCKDKNFCKLFPDMVQLHKERVEERIKAAGGRERYEELMREKKLRQEMLVSQRSGDRSKERDGGEGLLEMHGVVAGMAGIFALVSILFAMRFI